MVTPSLTEIMKFILLLAVDSLRKRIESIYEILTRADRQNKQQKNILKKLMAVHIAVLIAIHLNFIL